METKKTWSVCGTDFAVYEESKAFAENIARRTGQKIAIIQNDGEGWTAPWLLEYVHPPSHIE